MRVPSSALLFLLPAVLSRVISLHGTHSHTAHQAPRLRRNEWDVQGVGIHFTTSYATAAVMYESGFVEDLVRVQGGAEWVGAVERWADGGNVRSCETSWEKIRCYAERGLRWGNKWVGRPATKDVGILAAFLHEVKTEVEAKLQGLAEQRGNPRLVQVSNILPTFPLLPALLEDDVKDAMAHLGFTLPRFNVPSMLYPETNAAYAYFGRGLCSFWKDAEECKGEVDWEAGQGRPTYNSLLVSFDSASFSATLQAFSSGGIILSPSASVIDFSLGWESLPVYEVARAKFWARLQGIIGDVVAKGGNVLSEVVIMGEFATHKEFNIVLRGALEDMRGDGRGEVFEQGFGEMGEVQQMQIDERAPARGAAKVAAKAKWTWSRKNKERKQKTAKGEGMEL